MELKKQRVRKCSIHCDPIEPYGYNHVSRPMLT